MTARLSIATSDSGHWLITGKNSFRWLSHIPERKPVPGAFASWYVASTDTTRDVILKNINEDEIVFEDEEADTTWKLLTLSDQTYSLIRDSVAVYRETKQVPSRCENGRIDERATPFQKLAGCNASIVDGYGFFMEQGTGKTLSGIIAMSMLPRGSMVLIICPKQLRMNWQNEINKFCTVDVHTTVIRGGQLSRISCLIDAKRASRDKHLSVAIIGYDSIAGMWDALKMMRWNLAIADESHFFKGPNTKRWGFMQQLRETCERRIAATGTPIANTINDLWTQFEWMGEGYSGFTSFQAFKRYFGIYDKSKDNSYEQFLGLQNVPVIKERLSKYAFTIRKQEALPDLPDKVFDIIEVEMTPEQQAAYDQLRTSLAVDVENALESSNLDSAMVINNILTMLLKLAQITSGFLKFPEVYGPDGELVRASRTVQFEPNPKIEQLMETLAEKGPHDKTIVWAHWTQDVQKIKRACDVASIRAVTFTGATNDADRLEAERAFNHDDDCKVFIGNAGAGGTGLNLLGYPPGNPDASQSNANHTIYFSQDWSSLKRSQSEDRNHRRGVRVPVRVSDLCVADTIDEQIRARVLAKRLNALEITDIKSLLKDIFKNVITLN